MAKTVVTEAAAGLNGSRVSADLNINQQVASFIISVE